MKIGQYLTKLCVDYVGLLFLAHPVDDKLLKCTCKNYGVSITPETQFVWQTHSCNIMEENLYSCSVSIILHIVHMTGHITFLIVHTSRRLEVFKLCAIYKFTTYVLFHISMTLGDHDIRSKTRYSIPL